MSLSSAVRFCVIVLTSIVGAGAFAPAASAAVQYKTAVVAVRYNDSWNADRVATRAEAKAAIFTNAAGPAKVFSRVTNKAITFAGISSASGDAFGTWTLPIAGAPKQCDLLTAMAHVRATLAATYLTGLFHGVNFSDYQKVIVVLPETDACGESGEADYNANWAVVHKGDVPGDTAAVATHEMGHSLGLFHAGTADCNGAQFDPVSKCSIDPYRDDLDAMGGSRASAAQTTPLQAYSLARLGALAPTAIKTLATGARGTYRLIAPESTGSGTKLVMINRSGTAKAYPSLTCRPWWDPQQGCDQPTSDYLTAEFHRTGDGPSVVFHLTPAVSKAGPTIRVNTDDGSIRALNGQSITDPATNTRIRVTSLSSTAATIALVDPTELTPPTPAANSWRLTWPRVEGADHYDVYVDAGDGSGEQQTWQGPQCSAVCATTQLGGKAAAPTARARVVAVDATGNRSAPSAWVSLYEEGAWPTLGGLKSATMMRASDLTPIRVTTGTVSIRPGLVGGVSVTQQTGLSAPITTFPWHLSDGPFAEPLPLTLTSDIPQVYKANATNEPPTGTSLGATATYWSGVTFATSMKEVPTTTTDATPPAKPAIEFHGHTVQIRPATGEPVAGYRLFFTLGGDSFPLDISHGEDMTIGGEILPGYPLPQGLVFVVAYDAAGNWASSDSVTYTP